MTSATKKQIGYLSYLIEAYQSEDNCPLFLKQFYEMIPDFATIKGQTVIVKKMKLEEKLSKLSNQEASAMIGVFTGTKNGIHKNWKLLHKLLIKLK